MEEPNTEEFVKLSTEDYYKLSLMEKWARHRKDIETQGMSRNAGCLNKWVPLYHGFVLTGGVAWLLLAAIPTHHFREMFWLVANEVFVVFLFVQVLSNWVLMKTTSSRYVPGVDECFSSDQTRQLMSDNDVTVAQTNGVETDPTAGFSSDGQDFSSGGCPAPQESSALSYKMMVATAIKEGRVERKSFPYWSWVPCLICQRPRPPRCHHCTVCNQCVLKRDHHCYFTRTCVGVNNQRYFLFYLFWILLLIIDALFELYHYYFRTVLPESSLWDLFVPFNLFHVLTGSMSLTHLHFIAILWGITCLTPVTLGMFSITLFLTFRGLTKFEYDHGINVKDTRSIPARLRSVLGKNWGLSLFLPFYYRPPVQEDAVNWPHIKL